MLTAKCCECGCEFEPNPRLNLDWNIRCNACYIARNTRKKAGGDARSTQPSGGFRGKRGDRHLVSVTANLTAEQMECIQQLANANGTRIIDVLHDALMVGIGFIEHEGVSV